MEVLTTPSEEEVPLETFGAEMTPAPQPQPSHIQDFSWLTGVHLPAQAGWMHAQWTGETLPPGPHQSEPESLAMLARWWEGALRYVAAEIAQHGG